MFNLFESKSKTGRDIYSRLTNLALINFSAIENEIKKYAKDGGDINYINTTTGKSLLRLSIDLISPEAVKLFLELGADPNLVSGRFIKRTPLSDAVFISNNLKPDAYKNIIMIIKYLIEHGADMYKPNIGGELPINYLHKNSLDLLHIFYENGFDFEFRNKTGVSAISQFRVRNEEMHDICLRYINIRKVTKGLNKKLNGELKEHINLGGKTASAPRAAIRVSRSI